MNRCIADDANNSNVTKYGGVIQKRKFVTPEVLKDR